MKADILVFGAHPDDIEVACGGTVLSAIAEGKTVAVVDLTRGELGSRGCGETRLQEAAAAKKILGVHARENLLMEDAFFRINKVNIRKVIAVIRKYRPSVILCNPTDDRHPDHAKAASLICEAAFLSGLCKIKTTHNDQLQTHWRPSYIFHYIQHLHIEPDFVMDISDFIEQKHQAILAYGTQFNCEASCDEPRTYISEPSFMDVVKGKAALMGQRIGVAYAEGFVSAKTPGIKSFDAFIQHPT